MWDVKQDVQDSAEQERDDITDLTTNPAITDAGGIIAFVGKGVEFNGTITYSGTVRIDGYLNGEIHTDGILLVGKMPSSKLKSRPARSSAKEKSPAISWPKNA